MSAVAIGTITAVLCALGWAVLDVLRKQLVARIDPLPLLVWRSAGRPATQDSRGSPPKVVAPRDDFRP